LVFELPILIFFLTLFGIVTPSFLWKNSRYAILIIAVVAAIVTPTPDATTMLVFMMPMIALYFIGIAVSALAVRKKRKREAAEQAGATVWAAGKVVRARFRSPPWFWLLSFSVANREKPPTRIRPLLLARQLRRSRRS